MKYFLPIILVFLSLSCENQPVKTSKYRTDFTKTEQEILAISRKLMIDCYYGTLITIDQKGQPRARIMEPFAPEKDFTIWLATNPNSRKVKQLENNPKTTLYYFDKTQMGYVSLMGNAILINDSKIKSQKWKQGWDKFYKNQDEAYLLIKFIPESLELISFPNNYSGDAKTWQPHRVVLRN